MGEWRANLGWGWGLLLLTAGCKSNEAAPPSDMPLDGAADSSQIVDAPAGDGVEVGGNAGDTGGAGGGRPEGGGGGAVAIHDSGAADSGAITGVDAGPVGRFCSLPGSIQFTGAGTVVVEGASDAGAQATAGLSFLRMPMGYCAHYFGNVGNARQLRFAPGGELFVASPTTSTTGGNSVAGRSAIVILPDDDGDGFADTPVTFLDNIPSTQGMLFTNDHFYYQNDTSIMRVPYARGDRMPGTSEMMANITTFTSTTHWPKAMDQADDGTIYVANGANDGDACLAGRPFQGGILRLDGAGVATPVAKGFRNPIAIRCQRGHNLCFAAELSKDYSGPQGGREKVVPIHDGDDWGFPCCLARNIPAFANQDCSTVTPENVAFLIGDTPFSFDFEPGLWPEPYAGSIFVPLHGAAGTWSGVRIVAIAIDPLTGLPRQGSDVSMMNEGAMSDFALGWETRAHGRPAAITFAADGRMFVGNDNDGTIFWVAPLAL